MRWHCPPDTGFKNRTMAVWSRARSPQCWIFTSEQRSIICFFERRRVPTILNLYEWADKKHFVSLKREGQNPRYLTFKAGSFNHCTRAPVREKYVTGQGLVDLSLSNIHVFLLPWAIRNSHENDIMLYTICSWINLKPNSPTDNSVYK